MAVTRRFQIFRRLSLCLAGIVVFSLFIERFSDHFSPKNRRTDLRSHEKTLPIISPMIEPRDHRFQEDLFLLVIVSSSPNNQENEERRKMLRRTWGNIIGTHTAINLPWKVVFMMGKPNNREMSRTVIAEHKQHGDLLIGDYKDEYRNITTKLLMAFNWASKIKCSYILKTDDDVYIDIPRLFAWLKTQGDIDSLYGGVVYSGVVIRDKTHRHYVSPDDLSLDYYPTFCKGSMYVLSWNLVPRMVELSKQIKRIGPDDAYIGLLAHQLGVKPVRIQEFLQTSYIHWFIGFISTCQFQTIMAIGDSLTPDQVYYIHQLKTTVSNGKRFFVVCLSLHMKFWLVLFLLCTFLLIFFYGRKWRLT